MPLGPVSGSLRRLWRSLSNFRSRSQVGFQVERPWDAREIVRSLGTAKLSEARKRATILDAEVYRLFDELRERRGRAKAEIDVFFARSTDGGATWTSPAVLNANAATDSDSGARWDDTAHQIASGGDGSWVGFEVTTSKGDLSGEFKARFDPLAAIELTRLRSPSP
jgi:hypothetical protein